MPHQSIFFLQLKSPFPTSELPFPSGKLQFPRMETGVSNHGILMELIVESTNFMKVNILRLEEIIDQDYEKDRNRALVIYYLLFRGCY